MKVLITADELILQNTLMRFGHEVLVAADGSEALALVLSQDGPKVAILDCQMTGLSGTDVCRILRTGNIEPYVYTILITNKSQKDELLDVFEYGADDYLTKPIDGYELRAKLIVARRIIDLQDRLVAMREDFRTRATHDSLTALWNRQATIDALVRAIDRVNRDNQPCGLIIADVDHFKHVNDCFGHQVGDEVLKEVAARIKDAVRPYDSVGRYGGEEFLIIVPGCDSSTIVSRAEQIRTTIERQPIPSSTGNIPISLSLGAIAFWPGSDYTCKSLIKAADDALYLAKRNGRNRVELTQV